MPAHTVYFDADLPDRTRLERLYEGQIFVYGPRPSTTALVNLARGMIEEAFGGVDPRRAQYEMPVERYVEICAPLKPKFIHHPHTKALIQDIMREFACDLEQTYIDVPRLRMVTSHSYLTSGVGYAHHPHRDTWYSAPQAQLNWWLPIYEIDSESSMAFHPAYWDRAIRNGSAEFNYYDWNSVGRKTAAQHIRSDTRKQPKPEEPIELDPQVRFITPPGGVIIFSAAQLHSTVPNTSGLARYSIDFRTVNIDDVRATRGAANTDSASIGTSLRDFMRASDLAPVSEAVARLLDGDAPATGELVFRPELQGL